MFAIALYAVATHIFYGYAAYNLTYAQAQDYINNECIHPGYYCVIKPNPRQDNRKDAP